MAHVVYQADNRAFRTDAAKTSYVLGVNEQEQVQTLYRGPQLTDSDRFAAARAMPGMASFDAAAYHDSGRVRRVVSRFGRRSQIENQLPRQRARPDAQNISRTRSKTINSLSR